MDGPRACRPEELDELMVLINTIFTAGQGRMRECFPTLFCEENLDNVRIIREGGEIVCHIGICVRDVISEGVCFSVGNVGAVGTHADHRKKGYAQTLLRHCNDKLREDGVDLLFVSGDRSLYRRHGCARVGKVIQFKMSTDNLPAFGGIGVRAELVEPDRIDEWARIYQQEPVRFHRPLEDWHALIKEGPEVNYLGRRRYFYNVSGEAGQRGYVVLHGSGSASGMTGWISEYAGFRRTLMGAMGRIAADLKLSEFTWTVPAWDRVLIGLLRGHRLPETVSNAAGTVCILNLPQLAEKLRLLLYERTDRQSAANLKFEQNAEKWRVSLGNDELVFAADESGEGWMSVARLIFGTHDESHMRDVQDNRLTRVLRSIFPISRPEYGLSYI